MWDKRWVRLTAYLLSNLFATFYKHYVTDLEESQLADLGRPTQDSSTYPLHSLGSIREARIPLSVAIS